MRVLCVTNALPSSGTDSAGIFILRQINSIRQLGVEVDVRVVSGAGPAWVAGVQELRQQLATRDYDVVHAQYGGRTAMAAVAAARVPVVISFCGTDLNGLKTGSRFERAYAAAGVLCSQLAAPRADALIAKSTALADQLWRAHDRYRCHVIPNGVDLNVFREMNRREARAKLGWPLEEPVVLVSGQSRSPVKRLDLARDAVELARREYASIRMEPLKGVAPDEVPVYLNAADVVLLTSQHEGSPNIVKEALACNVSVVSVEVGDVRRWLDGTEGCWLVARDPAALSAAIVEAIRGGGRSAGREAIQPISQDEVARQVVDIYEDVCRAHVPECLRNWQRGEL